MDLNLRVRSGCPLSAPLLHCLVPHPLCLTTSRMFVLRSGSADASGRLPLCLGTWAEFKAEEEDTIEAICIVSGTRYVKPGGGDDKREKDMYGSELDAKNPETREKARLKRLKALMKRLKENIALMAEQEPDAAPPPTAPPPKRQRHFSSHTPWQLPPCLITRCAGLRCAVHRLRTRSASRRGARSACGGSLPPSTSIAHRFRR